MRRRDTPHHTANKHHPPLLSVLTWLLAAGCAAPSEERYASAEVSHEDQRQRDLIRPPMVGDDRYVWVEAQREYDVSPEVFWERFFDTPLADILRPSPTFPGVERTVLLVGNDWDHPGARRRLEFLDGHSAVEELLTFDPPRAFSTQFWALTSDDRRGVAHGVSRWTVTPLDGGERSRVRWRYGLLPHNPVVGLIVRRKAEQEVRPDQLEASLRRLESLVTPLTGSEE
ncbi:SRPBCC family protein [Algisphaera agarilytica]|uniref:Polyketide cyclase / dehydrase and lipid transport n=1 Tax=Algisphaera agarilytica TaxID=1385975 RepID=A0A7X0LJ55_9BACT|nr:SRPBCC family protein [Algisphaera agarilytica]MBB6428940.1 hypothetical protein [Algisphaera agarilytica]